MEVKGTELHVAFGPRDRIVPAKVRSFPSEAAATAERDRLVALHLARQYYEKAEEEAPAPKGPSPQEQIQRLRERAEWYGAQLELAKQPARWRLVTDEALLAACEVAPGDPEPWRVFADRLAAGGDPRGELALGIQRGIDSEGEKALSEFLGEVALVEAKHGFARVARVSGEGLTERVARFLATPFAASLRSLHVGLADTGDWTEALAAIVASPAGLRLRELVFDASDRLVRDARAYQAPLLDGAPDPESFDDNAEYERAIERRAARLDDEVRDRVAAVAPVRFSADAPWGELAKLERLVIDGPFRGDLGALALPPLRELVIRSDRMSHVADLVRADLPRLETLELWFGDQVWSGEDGELDPTPLCAKDVLPSVTTVRVFDAHPATLALIQSSSLAKRVTLVTTPPDDALAARYAHPRRMERLPLALPRGGEPPKPKKVRAAAKPASRARRPR